MLGPRRATILNESRPMRRPPRRSRRRVLVAAALAVTLAVTAHAQDPTAGGGARQLTLDNGLQVIVVENHAVPIATVMIAFRGGAMTQGAGDQGIPHLFEHMLFKGYRGALDETFGQEAGDLLAGFNGATSGEMVSYYLTLPATKAIESVSLIADLVRQPRFTARDLKTERLVVLGELQRNQSVPWFRLRRDLEMLLWGPSFMRKNTIGETGAILAVTPKYLEQIFQRYYVPNNAALIVTGDIATDEVFAAARDRFGGWKRQPDPFVTWPVPPMTRLDSTGGVVVTADVQDVTVMVQWPGPSVRAHGDATYAADVLADLVNDPDSPFQQRLVESGAFQSASLQYETLDHVGPITFVGVTTWERLAGALSALGGEFDVMRDSSYIDAATIAVAKKRRAVNTALQREAGAGLAGLVANFWSTGGLDYYDTYLDRMTSRTPADVRRFVGTWIANKPYVVGLLVNPRYGPTAQALLKQFNDLMEGK